MKFRCFLTLIASVLVFAGCMQESIDSFESIKLDKTYLTIPETGGEVELTITATQDWNFVETEMWPRVIAYQKDSDGKEIKDEDGNKVIDESKTVPSWLTLKGEMSGKAGETKVVFAAEPTNGGREIELSIKAGNNVQYFRVRQGTMLASDATCAEVIAGVDGKSYRVQGVCTSIANDYYGNFYLNDGTGEIYIYGTKDGDGQYNWDDFNIEVGDSVKVEGPRKDYNGTIELVDALFIKVIKSLIKLVDPTDKMVSEEGETFDVKLAYKGKGVFYTVADECSSWVKIEGMTSKSGEPTKLEPNPADTAIVTVTVAPYDEPSSRTGSIEFSSSLDDAKSVITFAFRQGVAEVSVADFLEKEVGDTPYKLTGKIANLNNTTYGNFDLVDATGSIYVYGLTATKVASNDKSFSTLGLREGDIVTIIGTRGEHKEVPQVAGPAYYVSHIGSTDITVKEFLEKEKSKDVWYRLTGKVTSLKPGEYGNFHLVDETGSVYVYGLTKAPVAKNDKSFPTLGVKEGDIVTLVGTRDRYDSAKVPEEKEQVGGPAYYISHVAGEGGEGGEEPEVPAAPESKGKKTVEEFIAAADKDNYYELTGTVSNFNSTYCSFDLTDASGSIYVYSVLDASKTEWVDKIKDGGTVTLYGKYDYYEKSSKHEVVAAHIVSFTEGTTGPETPGTKTERNLAFSAATASATLGQDFTAPTLSGETDGVAYSSSNTAVATVDAATGAVTLVAAGETTITASAEETETLQAGTASYTLTVSAAEVVEPEFEAGKYWIVANNLVAKPVTSSFGYLNVEDAWKSASSVASTQANAFTFTSVEGGYTIQDEAGKYYYGTVFNNAWSKNFNVSATLPAEGAIWKIVKNDDDTYTITNTTQPSYLQYSVSHSSFGHYTTAQSNAVLPTLVKVENAVPAVTLESSLTFEAEGGSQTITLPEGVSAVPSCDNAAFTATASANVVTVSTAATTEAQSGVLTLVLNYNGFAITKTVDLTQKAAPVAGETVVLHETFDKCQYGSSFANNAANGSDTSIKTDVSGWTFVKGYEAYKSAKFGGSSSAGSATTPKLGVSGDMTVTFVATPWANDKTTLKLSVVGGGELNVSTVTMKTSFSEHTVTITGATAETQLKFESNASSKCRFFLDDVKIVKN